MNITHLLTMYSNNINIHKKKSIWESIIKQLLNSNIINLNEYTLLYRIKDVNKIE